MTIDFPARSGTITVETTSGAWTDARTSITYIPNEGSIGEREGEIPPLGSEEIRKLIATLEFALQHGG